jgi:hypothetical protein
MMPDYTKFRKKRELHSVLGTDPEKWTEAFCQHAKLGLPKNADLDRKATEDWFGHAMMAAFEAGKASKG